MRILPSVFIVGGHCVGLSDSQDCLVYVCVAPEGLVMIDAGGGRDPETIFAVMEEEGLDERDLKVLLLTHCHADHAAGAAAIRDRTGCAVAISGKSAHLLETGTEIEVRLDLAKRMGIHPPDLLWVNCPVEMPLHDGQEINAAGLRVEVIEVDGHSHDSCCFLTHLDGRTCLFSGDVIQYGGVLGLLNYPGSSMEGYRNDLPKLRGLGIDALFPAHSLFTVSNGQRQIETALERLKSPYVPPCVGQKNPF
jgi:glyoxylase-like metal-dependent hydrolase (beta-lactamase superfamily II)